MPEELLLLLERVEKEGSGVTISYVYPKLPFVFQYPSGILLRVPGKLANHWSSQRAQVQLVDLKTLYQ